MELHSNSLRTVWDSQYISPKKQFSPLGVAQKPAEFITNQKVPRSQTTLYDRASDQDGAVWKSQWFLWRWPGSRARLLSPRLRMLKWGGGESSSEEGDQAGPRLPSPRRGWDAD